MEEKELIKTFENLVKDSTRVAEGTQYAQNLQILDEARKALKQVKENGVLHSVSTRFTCHSCNEVHSGKNNDQLFEVCKNCFSK